MFESLDFVYVPTADVDDAVRVHLAAFDGELLWKVRGMDTTVACVRVAARGPSILLSGHLEGRAPILVYRVASYADALAQLRAAGVHDVRELEIPQGPCASVELPDGQRVAVYELTRPGVVERFDGRIDD